MPRPGLFYLITALELGGAEQQVRLLSREFSRRGWDVTLVSMRPLEHDEVELRAAGVRVVSLEMRAGVPSLGALVSLTRLLRRRPPRALHALLVHANLMARVSRLFVRTPVLVTSARSIHEGAPWRYLAYRVTRGLDDVTTAVSGSVAEELIRRGAVDRHRIRVIPNGIPLEDHSRNLDTRRRLRVRMSVVDRFVWLAAGRLVRAKDYPTMLKAFDRVHRAHPKSTLLIAGDGPLEGQLQALVELLDLEGVVQLLGRRDDVADLMSAADSYVMSSTWEGMPMVLLEAAATSLPTVATDVAGNSEIVVNGTSGLLVEPANAPLLADAMLDLISRTRKEREAMGAAGRGVVETRFDLARIADRWESIYLGDAAYDSTVRRIPSSNETEGS